MPNAKRDENRGTTGIAVDTNGDICLLKVDPATGRLLIQADIVAEVARTLNSSEIDENHKTVDLAVDDSENILPLLIDNRNGNLLVDILSE